MNEKIQVIDAHAHIGQSSLSTSNNTGEYLIEMMDKNGVDASIVLPHANQDLQSVHAIHDEIYEASQKWPGRIVGMASINPRLGKEVYRQELRRCVQEMGFVGIKLEPVIYASKIDSAIARVVFECAQEFDVPVMIHTGVGTFSNPFFAVPVANEYPNLTIILAHTGLVTYVEEALLAAKLCPNIMLELSWTLITGAWRAIKDIGYERVLFGSDLAENIPVEITKINSIPGLTDIEREHVMGLNAKRIYNLD
ncbi:amidohydrolase family protein [Eubacteriales bacterium OttesenSCG-928-N14]|nr:amidohydrolase family protein [Eubacteriales bacterium OttesenSCG-928-N14]